MPEGLEVELILPSIGEGMTDATIGRLLASVGDSLDVYSAFVEISTEKATVELPSPHQCTVAEVRVQEGDVVPVGGTIMIAKLSPATTLEEAHRETATADILTGLNYLRRLTPKDICVRNELGRYKFGELLPFVETVSDLAKTYYEVSWTALDEDSLADLRGTLFLISGLVEKIERFDLSDTLHRVAHHQAIKKIVREPRTTLSGCSQRSSLSRDLNSRLVPVPRLSLCPIIPPEPTRSLATLI